MKYTHFYETGQQMFNKEGNYDFCLSSVPGVAYEKELGTITYNFPGGVIFQVPSSLLEDGYGDGKIRAFESLAPEGQLAGYNLVDRLQEYVDKSAGVVTKPFGIQLFSFEVDENGNPVSKTPGRLFTYKPGLGVRYSQFQNMAEIHREYGFGDGLTVEYGNDADDHDAPYIIGAYSSPDK